MPSGCCRNHFQLPILRSDEPDIQEHNHSRVFHLRQCSIKRIALFGGGRWATTLMSVLRTELPQEVEIIWVTRHHQQTARTWLEKHHAENIVLEPDIPISRNILDGVIIATSPLRHYELLSQALSNHVPALCEKPLCTSATEFNELRRALNPVIAAQIPERRDSEQGHGCRERIVGVHLEFLFAAFLRQFSGLINHSSIDSVDVFWQDPWSEQRAGVTKCSEMYVDIMRDQLPHCWSVLKSVIPETGSLQIQSLTPEQHGWLLELRDAKTTIRFHLSRRTHQRVRRMVINQGQFLLDFSSEPGFAILNEQRLAMAEIRRRPLNSSLASFAEVITDTGNAEGWPLAIHQVWPAIELSQHAAEQLVAAQKQEAVRLSLLDRIDLNHPDHVALTVDMLFPRIAAVEHCEPLISVRQQQEFASKHWEKLRDF
ncbi:MAG: Gfo/Idh/MocA family oxidoreductase [Planctomycetota bacterium]